MRAEYDRPKTEVARLQPVSPRTGIIGHTPTDIRLLRLAVDWARQSNGRCISKRPVRVAEKPGGADPDDLWSSSLKPSSKRIVEKWMASDMLRLGCDLGIFGRASTARERTGHTPL